MRTPVKLALDVTLVGVVGGQGAPADSGDT